ncbi:BON domain-containing protein [Zavarzinella formosa]|uniref:BON domain-containing protein n=1 Tax=Zavarzinella formosa TaxID=360055 RepID=UPI00031DA212|nr:BON domain-containing protein [Zavarzinella formosa]
MRNTLLLFPVLLVIGCERTDGEKLVRIGQISTEKIREAAPSRTPFGDIAPEASTVGRVRSRIKGDVYFQKSQVQVTEDEEGIRLRGSVPSREHLERAGQLAQQTVGVNKVVNELTIREP